MTPEELFSQTRHCVAMAERILPGYGEDAYQEAFLKALQFWDDQRGRYANSQVAWFRTILLNTCLDWMRRRKVRMPALEVPLEEAQLLMPGVHSHERAVLSRITLDRAIARLRERNPAMADVAVDILADRYETIHAAENRNTLKVRRHRAVIALAAAVTGHGIPKAQANPRAYSRRPAAAGRPTVAGPSRADGQISQVAFA